ncbi:FabD/lysophospholipase-like protein [Sistotremastrum suecicum HHB10207 ss-3]|uniref:FabD/lysophospholipase-like protein n=1 Tax=Sistotremastrum suecicum HHB10207 ss-3 TaxID=1314776 RepID=A0A166EF31_9AGAM|nr:FabD/lysophospholipase-like protein [Sistotremastrum suecicum HHB10207 ss-3]
MEDISMLDAETAAPDPQRGLLLLSLDGGGVRGVSQLVMLKEILQRLDYNTGSRTKPCDIFDMIGGSGMGGVLALFLGRLGLSIDDALLEYATFVSTAFDTKRNPLSVGANKFSTKNFEQGIKDVIAKYSPVNPNLACDAKCRTFVCAMSKANFTAKIPRLFRTYSAPKFQLPDCEIWEAARATSASPILFDDIKITGHSVSETYIGSDMGSNNPITTLLDECNLVYPGRHVACVLSLGTGPQMLNIPNTILSTYATLNNTLQKMSTDCEQTAESIAKRFREIPRVYFRLNATQGMEVIDEAAWNKIADIVSHTEQYVRHAKVDVDLDDVVRCLRERPLAISTGVIGGAIASTSQSISQGAEYAGVLRRCVDDMKAASRLPLELTRKIDDVLLSLQDVSSQNSDNSKLIMARLEEVRKLLATLYETVILNNIRIDGLQSMDFDPDKVCFPGTRDLLLKYIRSWVDDYDNSGKRLLWVYGDAGCGKSAIAHSLASFYTAFGRLGSGSFFESQNPKADAIYSLLPKISLDLAECNDEWKAALVSVLMTQPIRQFLSSFPFQIQKLIDLSRRVSFVGPLVILVDGFNYIGSLDPHGQFLKSFFARLQELPVNLRFIFLSQPDDDLVRARGRYPDINFLDLMNIPSFIFQNA